LIGRVSLFFGLGLMLSGCTGTASSGSSAPTSNVAAQAAPNPPANSEPAKPAETAPAAASTETKPALTSTSVPAKLKTAAYEYYGLEDLQPFPMKKISKSPGKTPADKPTESSDNGSAQKALLSVTNDKAIFEVTYSEGLMGVPVTKLMVNKDGVFTTSVEGQELPTPQLEMPANPSPGRSWSVKANFTDQQGHHIQDQETDKVIGVKKIEIAGKSYNALYVEAKGILNVDGVKSDYFGQNWFAKGIGAVKSISSTRTNSGQIVSVTLVAAK